jgi:hypothetical protein
MAARPSDDPLHLLQLEPFISDAATLERLEIADAALKAPPLGSLVTTNDGQAYINGCIAADVPIPPTIGVLDPNGTAGWRSLGFIPTGEQFIVGTPVPCSTEEVFAECVFDVRVTGNAQTADALELILALRNGLLADGFESGDTSAWSTVSRGP